MVRAGIALYGGIKALEKPAIQNTVTLKDILCRCIALKKAKKWVWWHLYCPTRMKIAVLAIGYADGYAVNSVIGQNAIIIGSCAVIGRVSMDMVTVDVGHIDTISEETMRMLGPDYDVNAMAQDGEIITYEIPNIPWQTFC